MTPGVGLEQLQGKIVGPFTEIERVSNEADLSFVFEDVN